MDGSGDRCFQYACSAFSVSCTSDPDRGSLFLHFAPLSASGDAAGVRVERVWSVCDLFDVVQASELGSSPGVSDGPDSCERSASLSSWRKPDSEVLHIGLEDTGAGGSSSDFGGDPERLQGADPLPSRPDGSGELPDQPSADRFQRVGTAGTSERRPESFCRRSRLACGKDPAGLRSSPGTGVFGGDAENIGIPEDPQPTDSWSLIPPLPEHKGN